MVAGSRPEELSRRQMYSLGNSVGWDLGGLFGFGFVLVKLHELGKIELGFLEELDLANHAVIL